LEADNDILLGVQGISSLNDSFGKLTNQEF